MLYTPPPLPEASRSAARRWRRRAIRCWRPGGLSSCALSFLIHLVLLLVLAYLHFGSDGQPGGLTITVTPPEREEPPAILPGASVRVEAAIGPLTEHVGTPSPEAVQVDVPEVVMTHLSGQESMEVSPDQSRELQPRDLLLRTGNAAGGGYEGRDPTSRARLVQQRGGTPASEDAVARGLAWLAAHQASDGSWRFDLHGANCGGLCGNPGTVGSTTAATGLALLPFLGAGETTDDSQYAKVVERGLYYLTGRMIIGRHGGDLQEGTMYAQGIAAIALCEALAMTQDGSLRTPAQAAIDFICNAQHEQGGWRYYPGQPGDTTVFGWQLMALKSARLAGLAVPEQVFQRGRQFLDSVQEPDGPGYGYMKPGREPTSTAVGLLSRMYYGCPREDQRLAAGVVHLEQLGPSRSDMYFDYYAHQVMHHYQGPGWDAWNQQLRDGLIASQSRRGHEHGSWYFNDQHATSGGRLYTTAMCLMILEVYYRHMPLYGQSAIRDELDRMAPDPESETRQILGERPGP